MASLQDDVTNPPNNEAPGTVLNAWIAIALHPSRSLVVTWASFASIIWIIASFLLATCLFVLAGVAANFRNAGILEYLPGFADQFVAHRASATVTLSYPIRYLLTTTIVMGACACFLPRSWGSLALRLHVALRCWALVQPAIGVIVLTVSVIRTGAALGAFIFPQIAGAAPIQWIFGRLPIVLLFYEVWYFAILVGVALSDGSTRGKRVARLVAALMVITVILAFRGQLT
jgi:hypothetical protein